MDAAACEWTEKGRISPSIPATQDQPLSAISMESIGVGTHDMAHKIVKKS
jgi:hypothetical protein